MDENMQNNNGMPQQEKKGLAIASMVLGITSIVPGWCIPYFPFILGLIGVILGGVSLSKKQGGKGMAIAGLVTSIISLVIYLIILIAIGASVSAIMSNL
jgi:hypothetical protein